MYRRKYRKTLITFCLGLLLGLFVSVVPMGVLAQQSNLHLHEQSVKRQPPAWLALHLNQERKRLPGRREPAAGRGCGVNIPEPPLTALSPETNLGFTVAPYPTFFFYIPQTSAKEVKFTLLKEDKINVYEKSFSLPSTSGIFSLSLSTNKTLPPLEVGKDYRWYFQIICSEQDSGDIYVDGWVQRIASSSIPSSQLERAIPNERDFHVKRSHSILLGSSYPESVAPSKQLRNRNNQPWYDALATLAEKQRVNPGDLVSATQWTNLLRSEGLNAIARKPLVGRLAGGNLADSKALGM